MTSKIFSIFAFKQSITLISIQTTLLNAAQLNYSTCPIRLRKSERAPRLNAIYPLHLPPQSIQPFNQFNCVHCFQEQTIFRHDHYITRHTDVINSLIQIRRRGVNVIGCLWISTCCELGHAKWSLRREGETSTMNP